MEDEEGASIPFTCANGGDTAQKTVSEGETCSNRLWGGLGLVGGVVESFGAGALCVVPEPAMLSKAGCVVVGAHSLNSQDIIKSGDYRAGVANRDSAAG